MFITKLPQFQELVIISSITQFPYGFWSLKQNLDFWPTLPNTGGYTSSSGLAASAPCSSCGQEDVKHFLTP